MANVNPHDGQGHACCPLREVLNGCVALDVLISVGDHCASLVPSAFPDDVHRVGEEGVCVPDDRPDIEVVLEVLYCNVIAMTPHIEVSNNRLASPIAIFVKDVSPITISEKLRVEPVVVGPRFRVWANANFTVVSHQNRRQVLTWLREPSQERGCLQTPIPLTGAHDRAGTPEMSPERGRRAHQQLRAPV